MKKFKPFEKVLIRLSNNEDFWEPSFFRYYETSYDSYVTMNGTVKEYNIVPYEGYEYLIGVYKEEDSKEQESINDEEPIIKENEYVIASTDYKFIKEACCGRLLRFCYVNKKDNTIICYDPSNDPNIGGRTAWYYVLPLSKFDPKDINKSRNYIYGVRNGNLSKLY